MRNSIVLRGVLCIFKLHFSRALDIQSKIGVVVLLMQTENARPFLGLVDSASVFQPSQDVRKDAHRKPLCSFEESELLFQLISRTHFSDDRFTLRPVWDEHALCVGINGLERS